MVEINLDKFYIYEMKLTSSYRKNKSTLLFNLRLLDGEHPNNSNTEEYVKEIKKEVKKDSNVKLILNDSIINVNDFNGFTRFVLEERYGVISFKINENTIYDIQHGKPYIRQNKLNDILKNK